MPILAFSEKRSMDGQRAPDNVTAPSQVLDAYNIGLETEQAQAPKQPASQMSAANNASQFTRHHDQSIYSQTQKTASQREFVGKSNATGQLVTPKSNCESPEKIFDPKPPQLSGTLPNNSVIGKRLIMAAGPEVGASGGGT